MGILSIIFVGLGLSMDAFAVSLTTGLRIGDEDRRGIALKAGVYFGGFQALMPLLGWVLGINFASYIEKIDHWIAFILLSIIGGKMLYEAIKDDEDTMRECKSKEECSSSKRFLILAVATSIDALAVGISFAFLNVNIINAVIIIGITTFILSIIAVYLGKRLGEILKSKAELAGGIILIVIGFKILLEHLGVF